MKDHHLNIMVMQRYRLIIMANFIMNQIIFIIAVTIIHLMHFTLQLLVFIEQELALAPFRR